MESLDETFSKAVAVAKVYKMRRLVDVGKLKQASGQA